MRLRFAVGCLVFILGVGATLHAEDKPLDRTDLNRRAAKVAYDAALTGTELFNAGDPSGCARLYQGTLQALLPMLDHQPKLVATIKDKLDKARGQRAADAAFILREGLDAVMGREAKPTTPLWDRLGGEKGVRAIVQDVFVLAEKDPKVNSTRDGKIKLDEKSGPKLIQQIVEYFSSVTGGPLKYTGKDMKAGHKGLLIKDEEFEALAGHIRNTLKKYNVAQAEIDEFMAIVNATKKDVVEIPKKPLWDRLGGEKGVRAVTQEFLATAGKDPKVNVDRNGNYPLTKERAERVEQLVVELVSSVSGGPLKYSGRDMKNAHVGMKITSDEFDAAAGHLIAALKKFQVPQAEIDELIAIIATTKKDIVEVPKK